MRSAMSVCGFIKSAAFSPIIMMGALISVVIVGMMEASTTRNPSIPCTRSSVYNCHWVSAHFASADRMPNVLPVSDVSNECFITSHVGTRSNFFTAKLIKGTVVEQLAH